MAKVGRLNIKVNGRERTGEVHFLPGTKLFHFKFPDEIVAWGSVKYPDEKHLAVGSSHDALESAVNAVISEYEKEQLKERKVIAYRMENKSSREETKADLAECSDDYDRERILTRQSRRNEEVEIKLIMAILLERTVGSARRFLKQELNQKGELAWEACSDWQYSDFHIVEWTPQAEKFFNDFYGGCEELIRRMDKFAGTPERVKKAITNSSRLLEAPKEKA